MYNYLVEIEYDGTKFVGWQFQKNGISIQEKIQNALSKIFKSKIIINGSGRTDKGVHALGKYANFKVKKKINNKDKFIESMNFFLNKSSISIIDVIRKDLDFHARYSATERIYEYNIINRKGSLSLEKNRAWHIKKKLDMKLLKKGAKILQGTHNFSTFRAASCSARSPIKKLNLVKVTKKNDKIIIKFQSKSFLQNQVRSMVGCLKYLSIKKWDLKKFNYVFKSKDRKLCAPPAPPHGLYLKNVIY